MLHDEPLTFLSNDPAAEPSAEPPKATMRCWLTNAELARFQDYREMLSLYAQTGPELFQAAVRALDMTLLDGGFGPSTPEDVIEVRGCDVLPSSGRWRRLRG